MKLIDLKEIQDPSINLAIEEYTLRHLDRSDSYLLFYINEPSIIIGRNQNYYEEVNLSYIKSHEVPVYRRLSGGGAVYHDPGNLNFCIITDYKSEWLNNYQPFNTPVIEALNDLGIQAYMDDRNAIRIEKLKISGNAQFSSSGRMFSHGTLLFDTDLKHLKQALEPKMPFIQSRAHQSVRSEIVNIRSLLSNPMEMNELKQHITRYFETFFNRNQRIKPYEFNPAEWEKIKEIKRDRYDNWSWNIGKSPRFSIQKTIQLRKGVVDLDLEVHKGEIRWISLGSDFVSGPLLHAIEQHMHGCRFSETELTKSLDPIAEMIPVRGFVSQFVKGIFEDS